LLLAICKLCVNYTLNSKNGREGANYQQKHGSGSSWRQRKYPPTVEGTKELSVFHMMEHHPPRTNGYDSICGVCPKYLLTYALQLGINSVSLTHNSLSRRPVPNGHVKFVEWAKCVPGGLLQNSFSNLNSSVGWRPSPALMAC